MAPATRRNVGCSSPVVGAEPCDRRGIMTALFFRAVSVIPTIHRLQKDGPRIWNSRRQNMVPESYWESFQRADALVNEEVQAIEREAQMLQPEPKWNILQEANQHYLQFMQQRERAQEARKKARADERAQKQADLERREQEDSRRRKEEKRAEKAAKQLLQLDDEQRAAISRMCKSTSKSKRKAGAGLTKRK